MQTWLLLLCTLLSSTIKVQLWFTMPCKNILVSFFSCNRFFIYYSEVFHQNVVYSVSVLWSWFDFVVGQSVWLFWSKFRFCHGASEDLKKNRYGFRASQAQCFECFCLGNILVYSHLFLSANVTFLWRYLDFCHVCSLSQFSFFLQSPQARTVCNLSIISAN